MRRIEDRKQKRKRIWMGIILAAVMVSSIFGIIVGNQTQNLRYNDFKFEVGNDNKIYTKVEDGKYVGFRYLPGSLENITVPGEATTYLRDSNVLIMTFNPNYEKTYVLSYLENIELEMANELSNKYVVKAVTEESEAYTAFPILTCENATLQQPIIFFQIAENTTTITMDGYCIILSSTETGFYALKDRLMFSYFGVMDG
ncbi:MAG: hypothetical protein ABIE94_05995 [archaeon]